MSRLVVVPLDGSDFGEQAIPLALRIAERDRVEVELVHVYEALPLWRTQGAPTLDPMLDVELRKDRKAYLDAIAEWMRRRGSGSATTIVLEGAVGPALIQHIAARQADLVVMTTHGRGGLSRMWLGGVASDLARSSSAPVLLIKPLESGSRSQAAPPFRRVLVPLDGSNEGEEAVEHAMAVAAEPGARYLLLHVITPILYIADPASVVYPDEVEMTEWAKERLGAIARRMRSRGVAVEIRIVRHPQPARAILECADESDADLIVMETHGWRGADRLVLGSVTDKVLRAAAVPLLVHATRLSATGSRLPATAHHREPRAES